MTKFKEYLESRGISGYQLAKISGVSQPIIQRLMDGGREIKGIRLETAVKIASTLDISIEKLYELGEEKKATKFLCMDCGNVWESDKPRQNQECPRCGSGPFMIAEYGKKPDLREYRQDFMNLMKDSHPDASSEVMEMLSEMFDMTANLYARGQKENEKKEKDEPEKEATSEIPVDVELKENE